MHEYLSTALTLSSQMKAIFVAAFFPILFASVCIYICWWYWRLHRAYAKFPSHRSEMKMVMKVMLGRIPKNGTVTGVFFQEMKQLAKRFDKEGFFFIWFLRPYLVIFSKEAMKRFHAEPALVNKSSLYSLVQMAVGKGIFTSEDEKWKKDRKLLDPVFYVGTLKRKIWIFNDVAAKLVTELGKRVGEPTTDIMEVLQGQSFDVMSQTVLGLKLDDEKYKEKLAKYFNAVHVASHCFIYRVGKPWLYWDGMLPFFPAGRKFIKASEYIRSFTLEILEEMKITTGTDLDSDEGKKKSFIRILTEQHLKDPTFTMQDVLDHATTIVLGAYDTTSCTMLWCLYLLGLHPEVQDKAFKELEAVKETDLTYEDICQLKYLECVIKETLRLYTTGPLIARKLNKEIQWDNYTIPNGTEIVFFLSELHRRKDLYPDPEKFDPERFWDNSTIPPWGFMPFAEGYRSCIGKRFAMMEMKVLLAHIIRCYKIETLEKLNNSDIDWSLLQLPSIPLRFLFTLR